MAIKYYIYINMPSQGQKDISNCTLCFLISSTMILAGAAVVLLILLISWGNTGFIGSPTVTIGTCTQSYYSTKYSNMAQKNKVIFIGSCFAALISTILLLVMIAWTCKICKKQKVTKLSNSSVYIMICINIMAAIPSSGYYLSFLLQINKCDSSVMDASQTLTILLIAAAVLIISLILLLVVAGISSKSQYNQVQTTQTQPSQQVKEKQKRQDKGYVPPEITIKQEDTRQKINYTRQNVQETPSKRKIVKEIQPSNEKPHYRKYQPIKRNYLNPKENVIQNLHPSLKGINPREYVSVNQKNRYQRDDQDRFKQYQKKYHDNDRRGILSRIQPQEKYRQEQPKYRNNRSPNRQYDRNYRSPNRRQQQIYQNRNDNSPDRDRRQRSPQRGRDQRQPYPDRFDLNDRRRNNRDDQGIRDNRNREGILARNARYRT